jgi:hypothetical protein
VDNFKGQYRYSPKRSKDVILKKRGDIFRGEGNLGSKPRPPNSRNDMDGTFVWL